MLNNRYSSELKTADDGSHEKGFTLVEVIISMIVFLIATGAIYGVLVIAQRSRATVNQQVQLTKNVRLALNIIGRDTYNAGFGYPLKDSVSLRDNRISNLLGVPGDVGGAADIVPPLIVGNNTTLNTFATPNTNTDQVSFLFKDSTFNVVVSAGPPVTSISQPLSLTAIASNGGTNEVTIAGGSNAVCSVNDIYVITGASGNSTLGVVTNLATPGVAKFASGDVLGFNQNGNGTILTGVGATGTMQKVRLVTYFVNSGGILTRREFANSATATVAQNAVDTPLVYGVQDFQIQYILDDGTISDNPSAGLNGIAGDGDDVQAKLSTVRQIRFTVTAQTVELNAAGQLYTVTMTATYGTRNLGYSQG